LVYAGNEAPVVSILLEGNKSFYFPDQPVAYAVSVNDKDDPSVAGDAANIFVSADYVEGMDKAGASMGHQVKVEAMAGKSLVQSLDCKACHKEVEKSIGPSYAAVSQRYQKNAGATGHLVNKIIKGGAGVWGETAMPAHPDLKEEDARQIVSWVLSLADAGQKQKSLPTKGTIQPTLDKKPTENGVLVLSASYTDKGGAGIKPLMGNAVVTLRSSNLSLAAARNLKGYSTMSYGGRLLMMVPKDEASFSLDSLDLTGISGLDLVMGGDKSPRYGYQFELHLDGPNGQKVGEGSLPAGSKFVMMPNGFGSTIIKVNMNPVTDGKLHNLYLVSKALNAEEQGTLILTMIQLKAGKGQADLVRGK
jgi:cytochrome c